MFCKNRKKLLDPEEELDEGIVSMPAEPIGFFGNLMLNSGGFFCTYKALVEEVQGG